MTLLSPSSIAVIGASETEGKVGHDVFKNLTQGFAGELFAVNPKATTILGKACYPNVTTIPSSIDLAVIIIPAVAVPAVLEECGQKGIKNAIVISAGFKEVHTDEGKKLEEELKTIAKKHGISLVGPNCLGMLRPALGLNASFAASLPKAGGISLISQSGALAVALIDEATRCGLGFSTILSIGNKAVMDECDYLDLCANDPETKVIGLYLESIERGRLFLESAAAISPRIPIVLLKAGVSAQGGKAAASHTGALAGSDKAIDAACAQSGMHRAHDLQEFTDLLSVLSTQPSLPSANIAIITNAGGPGILATDAAAHGLSLAPLSTKHQETLRAALPPAASIGNPIDVLGDAGADRFQAALAACIADASIEGVVVLLTPQVMTPCAEIAKSIVNAGKNSPLLPIIVSMMGDKSLEEARTVLQEHDVPCFDSPERAVHALAALRTKRSPSPFPAITPSSKKDQALALIGTQKGLLDPEVTRKLLSTYGHALPAQALATSPDEAALIASQISFPVVAKISSPDILHKTDSGGIRTHLKNEADVRAAYDAILKSVAEKEPSAHIDGVLIQKELPAGHECIVGAVRDPSFGPLVMVGMGGIYTEVFKDTSFRIAPITETDAYDMLDDLASWKILLGMRGAAPSDIPGLAAVLVAISQLMIDCPQIQELDLNPVIVSNDGAAIVDAKIVLS